MEAQKRQRSSKPKVRTGCGTCKSRHLKCDERKPTCFRCEKSGMKCLGYAGPRQQTSWKERQTDVRPILPRPAGAATPRASHTAVASLKTQLPLPLPITANSLLVGEDVIYFDFFRRQLVHDLSHLCSSTDFWTRDVIRQSMTDECVRHSVLAIGALSRSLQLEHELLGRVPGSSPSLLPMSQQVILNEHHQAALSHHVEATQMFRKFLTEDQPNAQCNWQPSTVLIVTLLFIAFELLQKNVTVADNLMTSGIMILKDYIKMFRRSARGLISGNSIPRADDIKEIEFILPRLAVMSSYSPFCISERRASNLITQGLELNEFPQIGTTTIKEMRSMWTDFFTRSFVFIIRAVGCNLHNKPFNFEAARRKQADFLHRLSRWHAFFTEYFEDQGNRPPRESFRLLRIHHIFCQVFMECCLDPSEMIYDAFEPSFREILSRCDTFIDEAGADAATKLHHTLATGLVPPLVFVAAKCRIHKVRMAAIDLLRRIPGREEAWDMQVIIAGHQAQVELEESGMDVTGCIPAESRYVWAAGTWDTETERLRAMFTRAIPGDDGLPHRVELELDIMKDLDPRLAALEAM